MSPNAEILGVPLIIVVLGLGMSMVMLLIGFAVTAASSAQHRIDQRVSSVIGRVRPQQAGSDDNTGLRHREKTTGIQVLDRVVKLFPRPRLLEKRLTRTGLKVGVGHYVLACLITGASSAFVAVALGGLPLLLAALIGVIAGVGLPHFVVGMLVKRRSERFIALFPEAIDLIVRGLRSGLPVTESMKTVMNEIPNPVGGEFRQIMESLALGKTLESAMWEAAERVEAQELRFFVVSMSVQRETGGNLAETLENLADILRRRRQTKLKIRALSSEARASAIIIGALPFIMFGLIYLVNPDYLMPLFTDLIGQIMLGVGLTWLMLGFVIMAKMVRFEI